MDSFKPIDYQPALNIDQFIKKDHQVNEEHVPMDVVFIGGGPAGLAGAIELARLVKKDNESGSGIGDVEIGVLEKSENLGGHNLSGAVVNPKSLFELFPELKESDFPFKNKITKEKVLFLNKNSSYTIPTPPTMKNHGNYSVSICELVRWMGEQAEGLGVNIFNSFPADALITKAGAVIGVKTTDVGLNRDGTPGDQHMPGTEITAKVTVLTEGTRGPLSQAYLSWKGIKSNRSQIFALGVKELWKVTKPLDHIIHTMGWPLAKSDFGGSWIYPMGDQHVSLGLVVGLDYKNSKLDVHHLLQGLKKHPVLRELLDGGELQEWGAKTIPEGGYHSIPDSLHGDGLLMAGDCVGFVNVPALKGIHYAIESGRLAAQTAFKALKEDNCSSEVLKEYDQKIKSSYIYDDLKKVRNMRLAFKDGFVMGGLKAGLMTVTSGCFPGINAEDHEDADEAKLTHLDPTTSGKLSKVDAVYLAGNKTRDDIPSHLISSPDIPKEVGELYASMCPAGVYEYKDGKLITNAPNCIDCKATDVLGPRWQPREGGSGPDYKMM